MTIVRTKPADTKLIVCVWHPFPQWRADEMMPAAIRKRWPEMRVVHLPDYDRLNEELPDTDIFVGASLRPDQFAYAKKLKWIHSTAAGVNQLMYPALKNSGVLVTNPSGLFSPGMAEHVIGMMVLLARNFMDSVRYQDKSHLGPERSLKHSRRDHRTQWRTDVDRWLRIDRPRSRTPRKLLSTCASGA